MFFRLVKKSSPGVEIADNMKAPQLVSIGHFLDLLACAQFNWSSPFRKKFATVGSSQEKMRHFCALVSIWIAKSQTKTVVVACDSLLN
jgi:hypothetical protein